MSEWQTLVAESTWREVMPPWRGRWVVVSAEGRGCRVRSLSQARRLARRIKGKVRRFHAKSWGKPITPTIHVKMWKRNDDAVAIPVLP